MGTISVIFDMRFSLVVHYTTVKWDEVWFATLLWQNNGQQKGLISRMFFLNCKKTLGIMLLSQISGGAIAQITPWICPWSATDAFTAIKKLIFYQILSQSWRKGRPVEACGPWLKRAPHICLRTFVTAYRHTRTESTKNWLHTFPLSKFILIQYIKEIQFPMIHRFCKVRKRSWRRFTYQHSEN